MDADRALLHRGGYGSTAILSLIAENLPGALDTMDLIHVNYGQISYKAEHTAILDQVDFIKRKELATNLNIVSVKASTRSIEEFIRGALSRHPYKVVYIGDRGDFHLSGLAELQEAIVAEEHSVKLCCSSNSRLLNNLSPDKAIDEAFIRLPELMMMVFSCINPEKEFIPCGVCSHCSRHEEIVNRHAA